MNPSSSNIQIEKMDNLKIYFYSLLDIFYVNIYKFIEETNAFINSFISY